MVSLGIYCLISIFVSIFERQQTTLFNPREDVAFLVHSCDGYRRYWYGWTYFFFKYHNPIWPVYFVTEEIPFDDSRCIPLLTSKGEWSTRLANALQQIPAQYIIYFQEDCWLTDTLDQGILNRALDRMLRYDLYFMKLQNDCHFNVQLPTDFNDRRYYIISHHPGLWQKDFLLSTLITPMTPFQHESQTNFDFHNRRLADAARCGCNQDFETHGIIKYIDVSRHGQLRKEGSMMLIKEGLSFVIEPDEILERKNI